MAGSHAIGTLAWADRNGGRLTIAAREAVVERHPRLGFKREIDRLMREQVEARPRL